LTTPPNSWKVLTRHSNLKELRTRAETGNHHTADLLADQGRGRAPR
jgi:hypothetical protein